MQSVAVELQFAFPERRQLQSSATDALPAAVQQQLAAAVAATLAISEERVLVAAESSSRVITVTIIGFDASSVTPSEVVRTATSSSFLGELELRMGRSISVHRAPSVVMRVTPVPSPPPSTPPAPPSTPPAFGSIGNTINNNLNAGLSNTTSALSNEMIWVIIIAVIALLITLGCLVAYCMGKMSGRKTQTVQIGRPGLRRQVTPEEERRPPAPAIDSTIASASVGDVRLIELGMNLAANLQRQQSGGASSSAHGSVADMAAADLAIKLEQAQAALNDVRESISPRTESPVRPRQPVDTRIRATADIGL